MDAAVAIKVSFPLYMSCEMCLAIKCGLREMFVHPHETCKADFCDTVDILRGQELNSLSSRDFEGVISR